MPANDLDAAGVAAWTALVELMNRVGPVRAWREMLVEAPDGTMAMVEWMRRQPMARRQALADELLGPAIPPK